MSQNYKSHTVDDVWECLYLKCKGKYASYNSDWGSNQCRCGYTLSGAVDGYKEGIYERMRPDSEEGCISMCEETPECVASSFDMMEYRIKDTNVPLLMGDGYAAGERDQIQNTEVTLDGCRIRCQNDAECMGYSFRPAVDEHDPICFLTSTQPQFPLAASAFPWVTYSMRKRILNKVHLQD